MIKYYLISLAWMRAEKDEQTALPQISVACQSESRILNEKLPFLVTVLNKIVCKRRTD